MVALAKSVLGISIFRIRGDRGSSKRRVPQVWIFRPGNSKDSFLLSSQIPIMEHGKLQFFPSPLHKITPRRRTMGIVKPMKEIGVGVEVPSLFPGSISQEAARSGSSPNDDLINTPHPS